MDRLTEAEVIAALADRGVCMTPKKFKTYRMRGNIDRPEQVHQAGRRGSVSLYPASVVNALERLERVGQNAGLRRSITGRAVIAWIEAPTAEARKNRSKIDPLRAEIEKVRTSTEHRPLLNLLFDPPNALSSRHDDRLDEAFALSETLTARYRKDIQPLINVAADMALAGVSITPAVRDVQSRTLSNSNGNIVSDALGELPKDALLPGMTQALELVSDADLEQGRLFLRRVYHALKLYVRFAAKHGVPSEHVLVLEKLAPIGMLKTWFGSVDAHFAKIAPWMVLWLANQYRTGNRTWLAPIETLMLPFEQAMLSQSRPARVALPTSEIA